MIRDASVFMEDDFPYIDAQKLFTLQAIDYRIFWFSDAFLCVVRPLIELSL